MMGVTVQFIVMRIKKELGDTETNRFISKLERNTHNYYIPHFCHQSCSHS